MGTSFITINTHSSIRLQSKRGTVIYVDPYGFKEEPHDADLVLVTHTHFDHFSPEDIAKVRRPRTAFVMPGTGMQEFVSAGFASEDATSLAQILSLSSSTRSRGTYSLTTRPPSRRCR